MHLARYWLGRSVAFRPEWQWLRSNTPAMAAPGQNTNTYATLLADIHNIRPWLQQHPTTQLTTRKIYAELVSRISISARSPGEWESETGEKFSWSSIWGNAYGGLSTNWEGDLAWKILHRIVKTKSYLHTVQNLDVPEACHRCGRRETLNHIFLECPEARKVWDWLFDITQLIYDSNIALTAVKCLLRADLVPSKQNKHKINLVAYLIKISLWHLWEARNRSLFEGLRLDHSGVIRAIKRTISSSIHPLGS